MVILEVQVSMRRNKITSGPEASLVKKKPQYAEKADLKFTWQGNPNIAWYHIIVS